MTIASTQIARPLRVVQDGEFVNPSTDTLAAERYNLRNQRDKDRLAGILLAARILNANNWKWFNRIGEVHFALTRAAKIAGYANIKPVKLTPKGDIEEEIDTGLAADTIAGVYSRHGGVRGLIERYYLQQKIAGESHLIRWMEGRSQDGWLFASSQELDNGTTGTSGVAISAHAKTVLDLQLTTQPAIANLNHAFTKSIAQKDYVGRVWSASPEWLDVPESPLTALDTPCDILDSMTRQMQATLKSRFAVAGMLYFSDKVREAFGGAGKKAPRAKTVLQQIYEIMKQNMTASEDGADVWSVLPIMLMGSAEVGKVWEHLTIDREIFEQDLNLRSELIDRILFGLDINAPSTKGNEDTSHWGAWQNSADELRLAVIPDLDGFCWTTQRLILLPAIQDANGEKELKEAANQGLIGVRFELDEASVRANRASDARELRKQGLLKGLSTVKAGGFADTDMMDAIEQIRWIGVQLRIPEMAAWGLANDKKAEDITDAEWERWMPQKAGRIGDGGDTGPQEPGKGDPGSPDDDDSDTPKGDKPI